MRKNNTNHNWEFRGGKPEHNKNQDRTMIARSPNGRVEVEMDQQTGKYWDAVNGGRKEGTHYIVSVYASNTYDYFPAYSTGEWIDHQLVAHPRSGQSGHGWEPTFHSARQLLLNAVLSVDRDGKWISGSLNDDPREYVHPRLTREEAVEQLGSLIKETDKQVKPEKMEREEVINLAESAGYRELAIYIFSQTVDDLMWMLEDTDYISDYQQIQ